MSKCLCYTMILCLTFCYGCKPTKSNESGNLEKPKTVDENSRISNINSAEVSLSSQDSIAIGDIYLGIDEKTFNERRNEFLDRNPRLNGRLIEEMNGDFHNGKLYSINIRSIEIEDESFEPIVQNNNELKQKWEKESHIWTSLYEKKYKKAKHTKINGIEYIVIKRGRCTIEVSDNEHKLPSSEEIQEELRKTRRGERVPIKICSVIRIYDKVIIEQIRREKAEKEKQNTMESLDVI